MENGSQETKCGLHRSFVESKRRWLSVVPGGTLYLFGCVPSTKVAGLFSGIGTEDNAPDGADDFVRFDFLQICRPYGPWLHYDSSEPEFGKQKTERQKSVGVQSEHR